VTQKQRQTRVEHRSSSERISQGRLRYKQDCVLPWEIFIEHVRDEGVPADKRSMLQVMARLQHMENKVEDILDMLRISNSMVVDANPSDDVAEATDVTDGTDFIQLHRASKDQVIQVDQAEPQTNGFKDVYRLDIVAGHEGIVAGHDRLYSAGTELDSTASCQLSDKAGSVFSNL